MSNHEQYDTKQQNLTQNELIGTKKVNLVQCVTLYFLVYYVTIKYSYVRIKIRETGGTCRGDSGGKIINLYMNKIDK